MSGNPGRGKYFVLEGKRPAAMKVGVPDTLLSTLDERAEHAGYRRLCEISPDEYTLCKTAARVSGDVFIMYTYTHARDTASPTATTPSRPRNTR